MEQLGLFAADPDDVAARELGAEAAQYIEDSGRATAEGYLAVMRVDLEDIDKARKRQARASLDGRANESLLTLWRRRRADQTRKLPPRAAIPASVREAIVADANRRCLVCKKDGNESSLQIGHCFSLADAHDLLYVLGDTDPVTVANSPENLFAQDERCNLGQGPRSQPESVAGQIMMSPRAGKRLLRFSMAVRVVQYCRLVEGLEQGRVPSVRQDLPLSYAFAGDDDYRPRAGS